MRKTFEDALLDLLAEYADDDPDEITSALELQLMARREQEDAE